MILAACVPSAPDRAVGPVGQAPWAAVASHAYATATEQPTAERDLLLHINLLRSDPPAYARTFIEPRRHLFQGLDYKNPLDPSGTTLRTSEGAAAVMEAAAALLGTLPMSTLWPSPALTSAARDHARDQARSGATGHEGGDGSSAADRVNRHGRWERIVGEVIAYGPMSGAEVVSRLVIDDGVPSRGHRRNLLDPRFNLIGAAIAPHGRYGHVVVIDFAAAVVEGGGDEKSQGSR